MNATWSNKRRSSGFELPTMASPPDSPSSSSSLGPELEHMDISPQEQKCITRMKRAFQAEMAKRRNEGRDFTSFFGPFALLRALRGQDGNADAAIAWVNGLFANAPGWDFDRLVLDMTAKLDAAEDGVPQDTMLPYASEVGSYIRAIFTAPVPGPEGGPVNYIPLIRFNKRAIYKDLEWGHFVRYMHGATVLRVLECNRLSIKLGKPVQVLTVFDLSGCGMAELVCPKFDMSYSKDVASFQTSVAAEIFGPVYLLNTPKFVTDLYWVLFRFLPERFRNKIRLVKGDGLEDEDFVKLAGGREQLEAMLAFRNEVCTGGQAGGEDEDLLRLARRSSLAQSVDVQPGQRVSWSVEVVGGRLDQPLGDSDVRFSVRGLWTAAQDVPLRPPRGEEQHKRLVSSLEAMRPEVLLPERRVRASQGVYTGSQQVQRPGIVTLTLSNRHSLLRGKALRFVLHVRDDNELQDTSVVRAKDPIAGRPTNGTHGGRGWCCTW